MEIGSDWDVFWTFLTTPGGDVLDFVEIEIMNWEKYNPKRDQSTYTWLRLNNDFNSDPEVFDLPGEQRLIWIEILCQASRKNKPTIKINLSQLESVTKTSPNSAKKLIDFVVAAGWCRRGDRARSRIVAGTTPTNERTNERTHTSSALPRLACLWNELADSCIPRVKELDPGTKRYRDCLDAWNKNSNEDFWKEVIRKINASPFCKGGGKKGWVANFGWMVRKGKATEIVEGNFGTEPLKVVL